MNRITLVSIAAGLGLVATSVPAQAGVTVGIHIGRDRPGYHAPSRYDASRIGFDNGYRDGLREGRKDNRSRDRYNYRDEKRYRQGDVGYRAGSGPRYEYINAYRRGFEEGYRQSYSNRRSYRPYDRR